VVLAGLIAAIMSSVDSTLNSASTLIVHDFVEPYHPNFTPKKVGFYGRLTTIILMIIAIAWAPQIANFGGLWSYIQQAFSILVPPIAAIFLVGVFWRRGNGQGAFLSLIIGHVVGLLLFMLVQMGYWPIHFTINVGIMTIFSALVFVVVSLRTAPPPAEKIELTTWKPAISVPETPMPWYKDYRYQSVGVGIAMLAVLIGFW
jgi:SSS family solute:Na+ symporter